MGPEDERRAAEAPADDTCEDPDDSLPLPASNSIIKEMYVIASRSVSIRDRRFSYAKVGTLRRSLSNASFRLNILRLSRIFAARR